MHCAASGVRNGADAAPGPNGHHIRYAHSECGAGQCGGRAAAGRPGGPRAQPRRLRDAAQHPVPRVHGCAPAPAGRRGSDARTWDRTHRRPLARRPHGACSCLRPPPQPAQSMPPPSSVARAVDAYHAPPWRAGVHQDAAHPSTVPVQRAGLRVVAAVVDHLTYHVADVERLRQLRLVPLLLQVRGARRARKGERVGSPAVHRCLGPARVASRSPSIRTWASTPVWYWRPSACSCAPSSAPLV